MNHLDLRGQANGLKQGAATAHKGQNPLEAYFYAAEQQPGFSLDPGGDEKMYIFPYAHFLNAEGTATEIVILTSTHKAVVKGLRLKAVLEALRMQALARLAAIPTRYEQLAQEAGEMPLVKSIEVEVTEDDDESPSKGKSKATPAAQSPAEDVEEEDDGTDLEDVEPPEHAIRR
jgi:hypothetical protein